MKYINTKILTLTFSAFAVIAFSGCEGKTGDPSDNQLVGPGDNALEANAGLDQTIGICDALVMDGNDSSGDIVSYVWSVSDGEIVLGEGPNPTLTMAGRTPGEHVITLTVTDDEGATDEDNVTVIVTGDDGDYDFSYIIKDPTLSAAQTYVSTTNAVLRTESSFKYWKSNIGASTEVSTTPGVIDLHFPFNGKVEIAHLSTRVYTFTWSYSQGHAFLRASSDGSNWEQLAESLPPAYGEYNSAGYGDFLPDTMLGTNDLWVRAELYSYGSSASQGGAMTNTAQFLRHRYDDTYDTQTFKLNVCHEDPYDMVEE